VRLSVVGLNGVLTVLPCLPFRSLAPGVKIAISRQYVEVAAERHPQDGAMGLIGRVGCLGTFWQLRDRGRRRTRQGRRYSLIAARRRVT
jgi:hypothetical protein